MYAIFETGGQQHKVSEGETLAVELLKGEPGETMEFDRVLLVGGDGQAKVGKPYLDSGKVTAEIVSHGSGEKINIIKFRRRKHYMRRAGHRQWYTEIKITGIAG
jgi:large subunit ribosomal protein L21